MYPSCTISDLLSVTHIAFVTAVDLHQSFNAAMMIKIVDHVWQLFWSSPI